MSEQEILLTMNLGQRLADLRQQANLSINDIAKTLCVCKDVIVNIESDNTDHIPAVFLRGYLRAYAKKVNLADEELQPYLHKLMQNKPRVAIVNQYTFRERRRVVSKRLIRVILFSLLLASFIGGYLLWQGYKQTQHVTTGHIPTHFLNQADQEDQQP